MKQLQQPEIAIELLQRCDCVMGKDIVAVSGRTGAVSRIDNRVQIGLRNRIGDKGGDDLLSQIGVRKTGPGGDLLLGELGQLLGDIEPTIGR